jgi:peptidoglycan/LPS O-acetylase OafA/YrhL
MQFHYPQKTITGIKAALLLFAGAFTITIATMFAPMSVTGLPILLPSLIGGALLLVWLHQFSNNYEPLAVLLTAMPLGLISGFVYMIQHPTDVMPLTDLWPIWCGALAGVLLALLYNSRKQAQATQTM